MYYETLFTYSQDAELIVVEGVNHMITRKRNALGPHKGTGALCQITTPEGILN